MAYPAPVDVLSHRDLALRRLETVKIASASHIRPKEIASILPKGRASRASLPSGVYLVRANIGGETITKRIVYLK